ncbi:hypothetical protein [Teredinibacter turnerae]|uniref:hypothetical protein n=1 Tax=Teredinibacter turnerae TaxID=2426 RepID=UPI0003734908|nr:hypothetical protein [Teredinibacter turnerae]
MLQEQIQELIQFYPGLSETNQSKFGVTVSGLLAFEASFGGHEISDVFGVEMFIPHEFPDAHPVVWEAGSRISKDFTHVNIDGSFCLAVPLDINEVLSDDPSLLGFVDKLLVPYLYSYCHWEKFKEMPFGERSHGAKGYLEYYLDLFGSKDKFSVLRGVAALLTNGYSPHEKCACGSGKKTLRCHPFESKKIVKSPFKRQMIYEVERILDSLST